MTNIFSSSGGLDYPQYFPETSIDFINNRSIPPEYTFTRNSAGTYIGADGYIKTAAANEPRFDYDPVTGEFKGLLVEESRVNYISNNSSNLFNFLYTNWTADSSIVYPNGGTTGGYNTFDQVSGSRFFADIIAAGNNTYTVSVYVKLKPGSSSTAVSVLVKDRQSDTIRGNSVKTLTNEWQRINVTGTTNGTISGLRFEIVNNAFGNSAQIYLWGAQVEVGSFPTSYIPTIGSAVTRQPDQLILNRPFNSLGTFFVESIPTSGVTVSADNGTSGLVMSSTGKEALYYNTNRTLRMSSDFSPASSNTTPPQNLNRISIGYNALTNSNYMNGHLKKFMYYNSPVTEDNLRSLTGNTKVTTLQT